MWPEVIVAAVGTLGASAAVVAYKARQYGGGWSDPDLHRINYQRGTQAPDTSSPSYNRYLPPPVGHRPTAREELDRARDLANDRAARDQAREAGDHPYGWISDSPDREPPEYDGPRG
jgi:hypothetical protein